MNSWTLRKGLQKFFVMQCDHKIFSFSSVCLLWNCLFSESSAHYVLHAHYILYAEEQLLKKSFEIRQKYLNSIESDDFWLYSVCMWHFNGIKHFSTERKKMRTKRTSKISVYIYIDRIKKNRSHSNAYIMPYLN